MRAYATTKDPRRVNITAAHDRGTAQAGAGTTITLAATASATDDAYNGHIVVLVSGTGAPAARAITDYTGSTRVATVATWNTNPDATSVYRLINASAAMELSLDSSLFRNLSQGGIDRLAKVLGEMASGSTQAG